MWALIGTLVEGFYRFYCPTNITFNINDFVIAVIFGDQGVVLLGMKSKADFGVRVAPQVDQNTKHEHDGSATACGDIFNVFDD